jgi:hypothetical protein
MILRVEKGVEVTGLSIGRAFYKPTPSKRMVSSFDLKLNGDKTSAINLVRYFKHVHPEDHWRLAVVKRDGTGKKLKRRWWYATKSKWEQES